MNAIRSSSLLLILSLLLIGCGEDTTEEGEGRRGQVDILGDIDLGDTKSDTVANAALVTPGTPLVSAITEVANNSRDVEQVTPFVRLFRLEATAGQRFAVSVRSLGDVNPYVIVTDDNKELLGQGGSQALLPMADLDDALVAATAKTDGDIYLIVYSEGFTDKGDFRLDVVSVPDTDTELHRVGPGREAYRDELLAYEESVANLVERKILAEANDGFLAPAEAYTETSLSERNDVNQTTGRVNAVRGELFDYLAEDDGKGAPAELGETLGAVWHLARQDADY